MMKAGVCAGENLLEKVLQPRHETAEMKRSAVEMALAHTVLLWEDAVDTYSTNR